MEDQSGRVLSAESTVPVGRNSAAPSLSAFLRRVPNPWLAGALWGAALVVGLNDVVQVHRARWYGPDFQIFFVSVSDLFHHRALNQGFDYLPGALVLLAPLDLIHHEGVVEDLLLAVMIIGLLFTLFVTAKLSHLHPLDARVAGVALALGLSGSVTFALLLENLTLVLLPFLAAYFYLLTTRHWTAAAVVLGVSVTVKPMLLPLVILLVLERRCRQAALALAVPIATSVFALALAAQPDRFFHSAFDTLSANATERASAALNGVGIAWGLNGSLVEVARVIAVTVTVIVAWRIWSSAAPVVIRNVWTSEALLAGVFLAIPFSWVFYPLLLIPGCLMGLATTRGTTRWLSVVGGALVLMPVTIMGFGEWPGDPRTQSTLSCVGIALIMWAAATVARPASWRQSGEVLPPLADPEDRARKVAEQALTSSASAWVEDHLRTPSPV